MQYAPKDVNVDALYYKFEELSRRDRRRRAENIAALEARFAKGPGVKHARFRVDARNDEIHMPGMTRLRLGLMKGFSMAGHAAREIWARLPKDAVLVIGIIIGCLIMYVAAAISVALQGVW